MEWGAGAAQPSVSTDLQTGNMLTGKVGSFKDSEKDIEAQVKAAKERRKKRGTSTKERAKALSQARKSKGAFAKRKAKVGDKGRAFGGKIVCKV